MGAEVVRWSTEKTSRTWRGGTPGPEKVELREKVSVRSTRGPFDVAAVREFVAALDDARIPGPARVEVDVVDGVVSVLRVDTELEPQPETHPEPAPDTQPDA